MKDRIKKLMDSQSMTQQGFAQMLGINPASLSQVLSGRTNPTLNHVDAIKKSFPNISYNWLLSGTGPMYENAQGKEPDLFSLPPTPTTPAKTVSDVPQKTTESKQQKPEAVEPTEKKAEPAKVQKVVLERNIKEIVIYYDNNTFETFVPKK